MRYRGIINFDFTEADPNQHSRLSLALRETGWTHVETSAFVCDTDDIADLWEGFGLVARQADRVGIMSALTFHIQLAENDFTTNVSLETTQSSSNALDEIADLPFPS